MGMSKIICTEPAVKQSFKNECDINYILKRYQKTGKLPELIKKNPAYGDFSNPISFQEAHDIVEKAQEQFSNLPAKVREEFDNNPVKFLEFANDEKNIDKMVELGLATAKPKEETAAVTEPSK